MISLWPQQVTTRGWANSHREVFWEFGLWEHEKVVCFGTFPDRKKREGKTCHNGVAEITNRVLHDPKSLNCVVTSSPTNSSSYYVHKSLRMMCFTCMKSTHGPSNLQSTYWVQSCPIQFYYMVHQCVIAFILRMCQHNNGTNEITS